MATPLCCSSRRRCDPCQRVSVEEDRKAERIHGPLCWLLALLAWLPLSLGARRCRPSLEEARHRRVSRRMRPCREDGERRDTRRRGVGVVRRVTEEAKRGARRAAVP
jgi:hypothetical protein